MFDRKNETKASETRTKTDRGGNAGTRQSQEVKKDAAVIFTDIPPGAKVCPREATDRRGEGSGAGSSARASPLSVEAVSASGVPVRGKRRHCGPTWPGRPPRNSSPIQHGQKNSSQFCALANGETRGYRGGHEVHTPATHSEQEEQWKMGRSVTGGGGIRRQRERWLVKLKKKKSWN